MIRKLFCLAAALACAVFVCRASDQVGVTVPDSAACARSTQLWPAVTSAGVALVFNAGVTEALKRGVHKTRPYGSGDDSFPSRHSSWAFTASSVLSARTYCRYPWMSLAGQTVASCIGMQRVRTGVHFGGDVAAGALLGMASAELGQALSRLIFGGRSPLRSCTAACFEPSLSVSSDFILPLNGVYCSGFGTSVHFHLPLWRGLGMAAAGGAFFVPLEPGTKTPLRAVDLGVGAVYFQPLPVRSLAFEGEGTVGLAYLANQDIHSDPCACTVRLRAGIAWFLTEKFAARASAGYRYLSGGMYPLDALEVSVSSVMTF